MRIRVKWLGLVAPVCFPVVVCAGQTAAVSKPPYALFGLVVDSAGVAISQADVELLDSGRVAIRMRSDTSGRFRTLKLRVRSFELNVRRLGFDPKKIALEIPLNATRSDVRIVLEPSATQLTPTEILAERKADVRLRSFYDRLANNKYGSYIEPETVESRQPIFASELLRTVPGVRVQPAAAGNRVTIRGCAPVLWVDGARMQDAQLDDVVPPDNVAAIEIYRSFSGLPSEYFDRSANCGSIIVWTRLR